MALFELEVEAQIENLRGFKDDLDELFWTLDDRAGPVAHALGMAIAQVAQRAAALEASMRHLGSEVVLVPDLPVEERRVLDRALRLLDGELGLSATDAPPKVFARIRRLLAAADDVLLAVSWGKGVVADGDVQPRAVVVPLVRSRG